MAGTAAVSTIVSDVPCAAVFMVVALGLFEKMRLVPGRSQFARGVMIGIPIASLIGGVGTPAGSSVNILGLNFLEQCGKVRVPFVLDGSRAPDGHSAGPVCREGRALVLSRAASHRGIDFGAGFVRWDR
jgi:hypothetical protein